MAHSSKGVRFQLDQHSSGCYKAILTIPKELTDKLYQEAVLAQKEEAQTYGFTKGATPKSYIEENYKSNVQEHLKSFLFHYFALSSLYKNICEHRLILANEPELESIEILPEHQVNFSFLIDSVEEIEAYDWKNMAFKAPQRKNYKDIDRQVESFIEQETSVAAHVQDQVGIGDWVCFDISALNREGEPLFNGFKETLWLRIGTEEVDREMQAFFLHKKVGDSFTTQAETLQEYFSDRIDTKYSFLIEILAIVSHGCLSLENIKKHFNLKTPKDLHRKLIEVYSYRNDLTQRRETVEKLFKQLLNLYKIKPRQFLIDQWQQRVLEAVQQNPDYYVYKSEKNFKQTVRQLAEKQLKEAIVVDLVASRDNIKTNLEDVVCYLTLLQRARTKLFVYFGIPSTKVRGQEMPISHSMLEHICLREKTLNHIIHTLTRKR